MFENLFVSMGKGDGLEFRRIPLTADLHRSETEQFETQFDAFSVGVNEEYEFDGQY